MSFLNDLVLRAKPPNKWVLVEPFAYITYVKDAYAAKNDA